MRRAALVLFLLGAGPLRAQEARRAPAAQELEAGDLHGQKAPPYDARDYTSEERERIESLFGRIICACPKEDWTKTLAGCPDNCAEPQKAAVRAGVKAGKSDEEIIAEQVRAYGTEQVKAVPASVLSRLVPYLALGALSLLAVAFLLRSVRPRPAVRSSGAGPGPAAAGLERPALPGAGNAPPRTEQGAGEDDEIAAAVERDLKEMDE